MQRHLHLQIQQVTNTSPWVMVCAASGWQGWGWSLAPGCCRYRSCCRCSEAQAAAGFRWCTGASGHRQTRVSQCWELFPSSALGKCCSPRDEAVSGGRLFSAWPGAGSGCAGAAPCSVRVGQTWSGWGGCPALEGEGLHCFLSLCMNPHSGCYASFSHARSLGNAI